MRWSTGETSVSGRKTKNQKSKTIGEKKKKDSYRLNLDFCGKNDRDKEQELDYNCFNKKFNMGQERLIEYAGA